MRYRVLSYPIIADTRQQAKEVKVRLSNWEVSMNPYELKEVLKMWEQEKLTPEQAIGQMLLHLQALAQRLGQVEQRLEQRNAARQLKSEG